MVGDLGCDLVADLETAVAIAADSRGNLGNARVGTGMANSDLNWWDVGFGLQLEASGGEFEVGLVRLGELLNRSMGLGLGFVADFGMRWWDLALFGAEMGGGVGEDEE